MGLSRMGDEMIRTSVTVDKLYGHRFYVSPVKQEWHAWYAWYPVRILEWKNVEPGSMWIKLSRTVWLQKIMRRQVRDDIRIGADAPIRSKNYTEYTSIEEYLRHG